MKYQPGDKIIVLHSGEEGEVVDLINEDMVQIDVKGVQFPVYLDQIDFPYFRRFTKKMEPPKKEKKFIEDIPREKKPPKYKVGAGFWISFLPVFDKDFFDEDIVEYFRVYLVNDTSDHLLIKYHLFYLGERDFELKNEIPPFSDFYVHDIPFSSLNDSPKFEVVTSLKQPDKHKAGSYTANLRIKPRQLFEKIEKLKENQEASFSYLLFKTYPDKAEEPETEISSLVASGYRVVTPRTEPAQTVVDLHIEKLADDWKDMSSYAKLDLQLKTFEKFYEIAVHHHLPMMIIVHGVGTGKLRDEIHDLLRLKKEVKSFVNQYHPSFGYGATEIYFQY